MFKAILLFIQKMALKRKLKKEKLKSEKNALAASADGKDTKEVKKIKRKLFKINILLLFTLLQPFLVMLIVSAFGIHIFLMMGTVSGNRSIFNKDDPEASESMPGEWDFDIYDPEDLWGNYGINPDGTIDISGGLYPKDITMKNRALIMEIFKRSAEDAEQRSGIILPPEYLFGIMIRETGGYKLFKHIDANKDTSWLTNLAYDNPACCKDGSCKYMQMGISHFVGGSVNNGKDTGDPATMGINNASSTVPGDHALGFFQWEIPYITNRVTDMTSRGILYPISELGISDSSISFSRPHFFYLPDQIYMCAQHIVDGSGVPNNSGYKAIYNKVINYDGYKKLNERNKSFIIFCLEQNFYGSGKIFDNAYDLYSQLIDLVNNGKIEYLDQLLDDIADEFYDKSKHRPVNARNGQAWVDWMKSKWGITAEVSGGSVAVYGVYSACAGKIAWDAMKAEVDAAEKETPIGGTTPAVGQYIEYVGSGKFKPVSTGEYYNQATQMTIFRQTTYKSPYNGYWSSKYISQQRMADAGCGVYSLSFALTNLTGTLISPSDVLNKGNLTSLPISHSKIQSIAKAYGLESYTLPAPKTEEEFMEKVVPILQKGGVLIGVFVGNFEWYTGGSNGAHYMTIRGYIEGTNKFLIYSSVGSQACGWNEAGMEKLMNTPLTPSQIIPHFNSEKKFTVVIPASGV